MIFFKTNILCFDELLPSNDGEISDTGRSDTQLRAFPIAYIYSILNGTNLNSKISSPATGNVGVLVYRLFVERGKALQGYRVLVMNLCVSDCLMGVYLAVIGAADAQYRGHYVTQDSQWRHSVSCQAAGFLVLLSSEVTMAIFIP